jgi:hypothetical protein
MDDSILCNDADFSWARYWTGFGLPAGGRNVEIGIVGFDE